LARPQIFRRDVDKRTQATQVDNIKQSTYVANVPGARKPQLEQIADQLAAVVALRRRADQLEDAAVEEAMRAGWNWAQVAEALGVTRQAVHKKHVARLIEAGVALRRRWS
jgi:transcriptional regulator with GAF, ATPase, and Fis domain